MLFSIIVIFPSIVTEVKLEHLLKVYPLLGVSILSPIFVTLAGIVIEVRLEQPSNEWQPILETPSGIMMEVKLEQP